MAMHDNVERAPKTLREGAVCFSCAVALLGAATLALQWAISLLL